MKIDRRSVYNRIVSEAKKRKRVLKKHDVRKNELLDIAQRLFDENGYDATPISAVLEAAGVAKGTFYHYFKSKEDLLDCLVARTTDHVVDEIRRSVSAPGLTALEKASLFFVASGRWKAANTTSLLALVRPMFSDENLLLRQRMNRRTQEQAGAILFEIVRQGIAEGSFHTDYPEEAVEMVMGLGFALQEKGGALLFSLAEHPENWALMTRRVASYQDAVERVLGIPAGSLRFADERSAQAFRPGD